MRLTSPILTRRGADRERRAFTLVELLVVIAIMGLMAAVGLPALKGFGQSNTITAAQRQLLDDFGAARQRAIAEHTEVYVVFATPRLLLADTNKMSTAARNAAADLFKRQYEAYALYSPRTVGDQPGRPRGRYLTKWQNLPDGILFRTNKFLTAPVTSEGVSVCELYPVPFPYATNATIQLHAIGFNHLGQLLDARDDGAEIFPLGRGGVFYDDLANPNAPTVLENPRGNSSTNSTMYNWIRIDGLTGRARVQRYEM